MLLWQIAGEVTDTLRMLDVFFRRKIFEAMQRDGYVNLILPIGTLDVTCNEKTQNFGISLFRHGEYFKLYDPDAVNVIMNAVHISLRDA